MSQKKSQSRPRIIPGERVGQFHFAPSAGRQFRLVAVLVNGVYQTLHTGPTIGDLWRQPWLVSPELESEVVAIRVEVRTESRGRPRWQALWSDAIGSDRSDD